jgi:hypothetical protein
MKGATIGGKNALHSHLHRLAVRLPCVYRKATRTGFRELRRLVSLESQQKRGGVIISESK